MRKIVPNLWYDTQAAEAAAYYTKLFADSEVVSRAVMEDTPSGTAELFTITLAGQEYMLLNGGPFFKFTPAISFLIGCRTSEEVDALWKRLNDGGTVFMPLDKYPFSERYGWTSDRFGLSWQVMHVGDGEIREFITPFLMFVGDLYGKCQEAIDFYTTVFRDARVDEVVRYGEGEDPDKAGNVKLAYFTLEGQGFAAMESGYEHDFTFNEAVSFVVNCDTQEEVDYYWDKLSADPEAEQCGWLKDKYRVSWQIVPAVLDQMMLDPDRVKVNRLTQALLKMKKLDLAELVRAFEGQ